MYNQMPYNNFFPYQNLNVQTPKKGMLGGILGLTRINWGSVLNNTQKTLNVINQAIPVYYQMKPIYNNAKTMLRIFGAMNNNTITNNVQMPQTNTSLNQEKKNTRSNNQPIFFS